MIPQTELTIKSYFQTGDQPTAAQFEEFIGTMFYLYNLQVAAAAAAQAALEAMAAQAEAIPKAVARVRYGQSGNTITTDMAVNGTWSKTNDGANKRIRFTYDSAPPHATHYIITYSVSVTVLDYVRNIAYLEWMINGFADCEINLVTYWPT